jgi:hypothetical protein
MIIGVIVQQPNDRLDYDIDCSPMFSTDAADTVSAVEASILPDSSPTPLVVTPAIIDGTKVKLWIQGGLDGYTYSVAVKVTSVAGRIKEDELEIQIREFD